jgi:transcriptional regulator GlxA family with amidase domain
MSHEYLAGLGSMLPQAIIDLAPDVPIYWISSVPQGDPIKMTAGMSVVCTHHLSDPAVQPGKLDIVLVPGPDPSLTWDQDVLSWLQQHAANPKTDILSVCTGIFLCGEAGLLKGKQASGPRGLQKQIKDRFEGVKLVGDDIRWVRDGNFWSSGEYPTSLASPDHASIRLADISYRGHHQWQ